MRKTTIMQTLALAMLLAATPLAADQAHVPARPVPLLTLEAAPTPPAAWAHQDPADSLYRSAREAMNRGEHERAAGMFRRIWERFPRSVYAPDAPYWEAFNRYRSGETDDLESALRSLEIQRERYARAGTRENGDAQALAARIRGQLAGRGDEEAARAMVAVAMEAAGAAVGPALAAAQQALGNLDLADLVMSEHLAMELSEITEGSLVAAQAGLEAASHALGARSGDVPEQCRDQVEVQTTALNALMHMNEQRALPVLEQVMARRDECSAPLRRRAVFMIAEMQTPRSVDLLLEAVRSDPDVEVRRQAVFWLSEVEDERAIRALEQVLRESDDGKLRERAIFALGQHPSAAGRQALRRVAQDAGEPNDLRAAAIFWLSEEGTPQDIAFLRDLFGRLRDTELRERVLFAVGNAGGRENGRWLLSVASDADLDVDLRAKAVFWASEAGVPAAELGALYDRFRDRGMRERILFALSQSDEPAAVERLIRIARTERDPELRKKAVFWLGQSEDPRAAQVLIEILSGDPPGS